MEAAKYEKKNQNSHANTHTQTHIYKSGIVKLELMEMSKIGVNNNFKMIDMIFKMK